MADAAIAAVLYFDSANFLRLKSGAAHLKNFFEKTLFWEAQSLVGAQIKRP